MLNKVEKNIIGLIQENIPLVRRPYLKLSKKIKITEDHFIRVLYGLKKKGIIRRFGATLRHQKSGYKANVMTAWRVSETEVNRVGLIMACFEEISHCYRRNPTRVWPYNLYTMIHSKSIYSCYEIVNKISKRVDVYFYSMLFSLDELKKTSMIYF